MRILLLGDVHGQLELLAQILVQARDRLGIAAACQAGDFGFYRRFVGPRRPLPQFVVPVYAVCGNHENHRLLARRERSGAAERWARHNLFYQPRPSVRVFDGCGVGFLGGALNVDRPQRGSPRRGTSNYLTVDQIGAAVELFDRLRPRLLVTHSCPTGIGIGMRGNPRLAHLLRDHVIWRGFDPGHENDCGERQLERLWRRLRHRPPVWVFGHFHEAHAIELGGARFVSLPALDGLQRWQFYDTDAGELVELPRT
ncbi:MAG: metallophosphoesterase family protein [Planctomycetota bacterium]